MRILYFDCWSPKGHLQFNSIHLEALSQIGDVFTIFREGLFTDINLPHVKRLIDIPNKYYLDYSSSIRSRVLLTKMIRFIWKKIDPKEWDYIILASYDATSLFLSRKFKNAFVIDHNTVADLDNPLKGWFFRHLSGSITHVIFNDDMKRKLDENGICNNVTVPHGFLPMKNLDSSHNERNDYQIAEGEKIVFVPSLSRVSEDLIGEFVYNENVNNFLKWNNLVLFTKSPVERPSLSNVRIIKGYISQNDYEFLFKHSICNILLYSSAFKYRTSGVLNECFANRVPCIMNHNEALMTYGKYFVNSNFVFSNIEEMKESILSVLHWNTQKPYYQELDEIASPLRAWKTVLLA